MKKLLVAGATCFIGERLVHLAAGQGYEICAVVRRGSEKAQKIRQIPHVTVVELDMEEYGQIGKYAVDADCFVDLAWNGTRGAARLDEARQEQNYRHSLAAIRGVTDAGCKKILLAGSQAEYGLCTTEISEETPCAPNTAYGKWKLQLFRDALELCEARQATLIEPRFFSLYGPGDYENTVIMSCIRNMRANQPCKLTQCIQMWDYLYLDDAIEALLRLCKVDCPSGAYNFGSGDTRELKGYIEELRDILKSRSDLLYGAVPYTAAGIVSIHPSIEKLRQTTGWTPKTSFRHGIEAILEATDA